MSVSYARASRIASSCPKDFDFQFFVYQTEGDYPMWMSPRRIRDGMYALKESIVWNSWLCVITMICIIIYSFDYRSELKIFSIEASFLVDMVFNVVYFLDIIGRGMNDYFIIKHEKLTIEQSHILLYIFDVLSYLHYGVLLVGVDRSFYLYVAIACYYARMHRPITFLWSLLDHHLIGNIFFSLLKYMYFVLAMRVFYSNFFIWTGNMQITSYFYPYAPPWIKSTYSKLFFRTYYFMTLLVVSIGLDDFARTDIDRMWHVMVMISGTLMVTGITIAALAIIIGIYLEPEENFRARFRLIMDEMKSTNVPLALCDKVDTFYRMYWNKQKAISVTRLLPIFPPSLSSMICTDMYFEAQQKSRVLRDLSYHFLSEIAKHMQTINYVPGDTIVTRNTPKTSIIYIAYGDVEMLTAEDDDTPIFRFTRGSVINPCGASVVVGSTLAHVGIRAATFCTAHVLKVADLWRIAVKMGKTNGQNFILHSSFEEHFEKVKKHYAKRHHTEEKYKSTIHLLKRNLMELKQARDANNKLLLDRADVFLEIAGCYIMRNRKDTSLTEDADGICLRSTFPCILQPMSSLEVVWHLFISLVTLVVTFVYPYYFVYRTSIPPGFRFFDYMVSFLYILDIITYLSIGAKIGEGVPVTFTHTSLKQIQSLWFVIDVLSVSPIFEFVGDGHFAGLNKLFKIPKVIGMLKKFEDIWIHQANSLRFMSYFLITILLCYLVAAFNQVVMCELHHYCEVTDLDTPPHWSQSNANEQNVELRLVYGLYWSISMITFTSLKTAPLSRYWNLTALMLGLLMFCTNLHILLESTYSATISVTENLRFEYDECIQTVKDFLLKNNVNAVVRQRFVSYLQLCWFTDKAYSINHQKTSILFDLPAHVHKDIMAMQRSKYLLSVPFMRFISQSELKAISSGARLFYTSPNEILLCTGDISNEIYVIKQGFCEVLSPITQEPVAIISTKNYFGDLECLLRIPAYYTVRAVSHVQIFSISRKILMKEISTPKMRDAINFAKKQPEFANLMHRQQPFLSYSPLPPPPNRELFPLLRKHEPDIAFLHPFNRLGFFSILRYVFPRYTIRPDGKYLQRYEFFRATCAFLSANIFPLYCTLVLQWPALWYIAWLLDISAYLDIIQRMLVGYFNEKAILVYHPASTAAYYMKGAFMVDMFACLPLEALDNIRQTIYTVQGGYILPNTVQILMYNRLVQLYRVPNALGYLINYLKREDIIFIIKTLPLFMATIVVCTSLLMLTSVRRIKLTKGSYTILPGLDNESGGWINRTGYNVAYNITETSWNLVLTMIYWVTYELTNTGFNIFQPTKISQLYYLFFGMLLGQLLTTYFSVRVISIRSNVNQALGSFQHNMQDIKTFMKKENFDEELQQEVIAYYDYMWEKTGGTNYRTVLKMCDQITLRTDAILHIYGQTFSKCPILHHCEQSLLRVIGRAVHSTYFKQNMMIIDREEVLSDLYFLDYGTVEVRDDNNETILTKLPRGSLFGNLTNVSTALSSRRFVANSNIHILKINSQIFFSIIADFPTVRILLKKHRPNEECYIIGSVQGKVMTIWKERAMSSPMIVVTREGFLKYLHNHNKAMQVYLILVSMACVYLDIYNAGFLDNSSAIVGVLYALDFLFALKILINYALPFITEESESRGVLMSSRKTYYRTEFKYDVISVLPLELLALIAANPWDYIAYLRLNRVFRAVTIYNCFKKYHQNLSINLTLTTMTMVFTWFSLFVHSATCIWYFLGTVEENKKPKSSWRYTNEGKPWCDNDYICSLYFILTTFTQNGVADILPRQRSEVVFVIILMAISNMLYMIYVGEFSNILKYQAFRCFMFYGKSLELKAFLKNNRVSKVLVEMAEKYTLHLWRESRGLQEPRFLKAAPQCLRLRIMAEAYMHHLSEHDVFKDCEPMFLRHLAGYLTPYYYNDSMYVIRDGEITNSMYFIHKGRVEEWDEILEDQTQLFEMNSSFGVFQGLNRDVPFNYSYKTIVKSQILILNIDAWKYLLDHFPKSKAIIYPDPKDKQGKKEDIPGGIETFDESKFPVKSHGKFGEADTAKKPPKTKEEPKKPDTPAFKTLPPAPGATGTWPLDSRRRSSEIPYDNDEPVDAGHEEKEETFQLKLSPGRRKSTVQNVDKAKVDEELRMLASGQSISMPAESKVESKTPAPLSSSPWPLDNRRASEFEGPATKAEEEEAPKPKPMPSRRKSVVHDVDRQAVNEELRKLSSAPKISESQQAPKADKPSSPWPLDNRRASEHGEPATKAEEEEAPKPKPMPSKRKSVVYDVDRQAVNEELRKLSSAPSIPEPQIPLSAPPGALQASSSQAPQPDKAFSPFPLDNRRASEFGEPASKAEEEEEPPKPMATRRKSMIHGVDRQAVNEELRKLSSAQKIPESEKTPQPDKAPVKKPLLGKLFSSSKPDKAASLPNSAGGVPTSVPSPDKASSSVSSPTKLQSESEKESATKISDQSSVKAPLPFAVPSDMKPEARDDEFDFPFVKQLRSSKLTLAMKEKDEEIDEKGKERSIPETESPIKKETAAPKTTPERLDKDTFDTGSKKEKEIVAPKTTPERRESERLDKDTFDAGSKKEKEVVAHKTSLDKSVTDKLDTDIIKKEQKEIDKAEKKEKDVELDTLQQPTQSEAKSIITGSTPMSEDLKEQGSIEKKEPSKETTVKQKVPKTFENESIKDKASLKDDKDEDRQKASELSKIVTDKKETSGEDIELKTFTAVDTTTTSKLTQPPTTDTETPISKPMQKTKPKKVASIVKPDSDTVAKKEIMTPKTLPESTAKDKTSLSEEHSAEKKKTSKIEDKKTEKDKELIELKPIISFHDISPQMTTEPKSPFTQESGHPVTTASEIEKTSLKKTGHSEDAELKTLLSSPEISRQATATKVSNIVPRGDVSAVSVTETNIKPKKGLQDKAILDKDKFEEKKAPPEVQSKREDETIQKPVEKLESKMADADVPTKTITDKEKDLKKEESGTDKSKTLDADVPTKTMSDVGQELKKEESGSEKSVLLLKPGSGTSYKSEKIFMHGDSSVIKPSQPKETSHQKLDQKLDYNPMKKENSLERIKKEEIEKLNKQSFSSISSSSFEDIHTEFGETEKMSVLEKIKSAVSAKSVVEDERDNLRLAQENAATATLSKRIKDENIAAVKKTESVFAAESRIMGKSQVMKKGQEPGASKGAAISAPSKKSKTATEKTEFASARQRRRSVRIFRSASDEEEGKDKEAKEPSPKEPEKKPDT